MIIGNATVTDSRKCISMYYYAAFNAPCVCHKDDKSRAFLRVRYIIVSAASNRFYRFFLFFYTTRWSTGTGVVTDASTDVSYSECIVINMVSLLLFLNISNFIHHHFICPIIQHYAHLHQYNLEEQDSKIRQEH